MSENSQAMTESLRKAVKLLLTTAEEHLARLELLERDVRALQVRLYRNKKRLRKKGGRR